MRVKVHIMGFTETLTDKVVEVIVPEGTTVSGLLAGMIEIWGDNLSPHLFKPGAEELLPNIRLTVNGQTIQFLKGMETELNDGDEVLLLPIAASG
jgi:sulfur-carrier protein